MQAMASFFTNFVQRVLGGGEPAPQAWQHGAPTPDFRVRWERAAAHFASLPLETYYDRAMLERMTVRELKAVMAERGLAPAGLLEKVDLVACALEGADTSSSSAACSICSESYVGGEDMLRVLPCSHRFHVECIDKWFLNPVDYSRRPSCPLCKLELPVSAG